MPFPYDKYPWLNFQELNLAYFIKHFREIFEQWDTLLNEMYAWKDATDEDLAEWKTTVETGISSWETGLQQSMEDWKDETEADISAWEAATLSALDAWKTASTVVFEQIRTEAAASAQAAAGSAASAQTALAGAQAAQAAAEAAAARIQSELTQIQTNTADISDLKTQTEYHEPYSYAWHIYGINANGKNNSRDNRIRSAYTEIIDDNIAVEIQPGYKAFIYLYTAADGDTALGYGTLSGITGDFTTESGECKPSLDYTDARYFRVCASRIDDSTIAAEDVDVVGSNIQIKTGFDRFEDIEKEINSIRGDVTEIQGDVTEIQGDVTEIQGDVTEIQGDVTGLQNSVFLNASPSMFNRMGICGASWDCGYYYDTTSHAQKHVKQSWGANLARNHGNTCNIYAHQSMNTRTYLENTNCLPALLADDPCGMYYVGLGGNDAADLGLSYLGTISDITQDYTQNPDTFYGNYARIVEQIMNKAPNARIMCAMYYDENVHNATRGAFYNAVVEIAEHYNLPHFNWADDSWYKSTIYSGLLKNHPTAPQLSGIAYAFDRLFSKIAGRDKWYDYFVAYTGFDFAT